MRKELSQQLLRELLRNSKRSDRELAKVLGVSQPTITRTRRKLEESGIIQSYTIIPDLRARANFAKIRPEILSSEIREKAQRFIAEFPNTLFASAGEGLGFNAVSISLYKSYTEFQRRVHLFRTEWKDMVEDIQSFVVVIGEGEFKRFSLTYLKDAPP